MVIGFTVAIVMSHLSHGYIGGVLNSIVKFIPTIVGYFLVAHGINSQKKAKFFILLLIFLTTFLAYEGYKQSTTGVSLGGMEPIYQNSVNLDGERVKVIRIRWYGMFNDPNDLGLALVLVVPLLVDMAFRRKWIIPGLCLPVILYALYLTNSRGAMVALMASIFAYLVLRYRSMKGVVIGLMIAVILVTFGPSRLTDMSAGGESANGRVEAWYQGLQMLESSPIFGVGKGMFKEYHCLTAHNSYVLVLAELGLFGTLFFVGLFFYPFQWVWENIFKRDDLFLGDETEETQLCSIYGCLVGIMFAIFFLSRSYILLPFMLVGFISSLTMNEKIVEAHVEIISYQWSNLLLFAVLEIVFFKVIVTVLL